MSLRNILAIAAILVCVLSIHAMPAASQGNPEVNDLSLSVASDTQGDGKTTSYDRQLLAVAPQDTAPAPPAANRQDGKAPPAAGNTKANAGAEGNALPSQAEGTNRPAEASQSWLEYGLLVLLLAMVLLLAANLMLVHRPPKQH